MRDGLCCPFVAATYSHLHVASRRSSTGPTPTAPVDFTHSLSVAARYHQGYNIYHRHAHVVDVLRAIQKDRPSWWNYECSKFVDTVKQCPSQPQVLPPFAVIVIEGLDASGKTTMATELSRRLHGRLIRTPEPKFEGLRKHFRTLPEPLARAFYCACNYLAAYDIVRLATSLPVVVDRFWGSTAAMALALACRGEDETDEPHLQLQPATTMPPTEGTTGGANGSPPVRKLFPERGNPVYDWPMDLPRFHRGYLLDVGEELRQRRMNRRGDENAEEAVLRQDVALRRRIKTAYTNMGLYEELSVPKYMLAVNHVIDWVEMASKQTFVSSMSAPLSPLTGTPPPLDDGHTTSPPESLSYREKCTSTIGGTSTALGAHNVSYSTVSVGINPEAMAMLPRLSRPPRLLPQKIERFSQSEIDALSPY